MRRPSQVFAAVATGGLLAAAAAVFMLSPPSVAAETATCNPGPQTADAKVVLHNVQFDPSSVSLPAAGMSVCWEHEDGQTPHTITFDSSATVKGTDSHPDCTQATAPAHPENCFKQGDQAVKIVFATGGTFNYHCKVHPDQMKGVVIVAGGAPPGRTTTTRATTATTKAGSTSTTVGALSSETTTTLPGLTSTTSNSTTSSSIASATTAPGTAVGPKNSSDKPSGVLEAVGVLLLAAAAIALIPSWRRLT